MVVFPSPTGSAEQPLRNPSGKYVISGRKRTGGSGKGGLSASEMRREYKAAHYLSLPRRPNINKKATAEFMAPSLVRDTYLERASCILTLGDLATYPRGQLCLMMTVAEFLTRVMAERSPGK